MSKASTAINKKFQKYNLMWSPATHPLWLEMEMVRRGGRWKMTNGGMAGEGMHFHFKRVIQLLWPSIVWHKWVDMFVENYLDHRTMAVIGAASTGKTCSAALCALADYYCFPSCTTVIVCSTSKERLEDRILGEIKRLHRDALSRTEWLPGHLIEGRQRIVTNPYLDPETGRDFRNGLVGVAAKLGANYVGLGEFAGIKNKRVRLFGDEIHLLPRVFVDAIANLDKNPDFKAVGLGNPKDTLDALGVLAEPAAEMGFWEGGIDQTGGSKTWKTRRPDGVCLQLVGSDSPNLDGKLGIPLLTQEAIDRDIAFWGKESLQFTMMNDGRMPRGQSSRRVITRQECVKFKAMEPPIWLNSNRTKIAFLDAAYGGVGGDRCIFGELNFGEESTPLDPAEMVAGALVSQPKPENKKRQIIALVDLVIVPVSGGFKDLPTDQIVNFVMGQCKTRNIPPENFFFDSGMRTALVQTFSRLWSTKVNSIDCGGPASQRKVSHDIDVLCRDYYSKYVTELWYSVRLAILAGQFRGMTEDAMIEFASREWGMVGANKIELETKAKMKLKTGRSPDLADAVAIGMEGARQKGFVIRRLDSARKPEKRETAWKRQMQEKSKEFWKSGALVEA